MARKGFIVAAKAGMTRKEFIELKITELLTGQSLAVPGTTGSLYALNLEAVRLKFFTDYGVLANLFDVYSGETFALRIGIEQSPTVRERYRLRFLNSYGVYEVFSLEGEASVTPGMDEDEDAVFKRSVWQLRRELAALSGAE